MKTIYFLVDGVPMVACRVCQNMIDISGKKDQVINFVIKAEYS